MDFMKVLDQTVREIKREVNLKVLKVPEIEQKVLDATSDEPWGPHGSDLADIARATKKFTECQMIMNVLWQRLSGTDANWRYVYKALAVIEYLLANASERAVDDILDNSSQIAKLSRFEHVEPNGKDVGLNVRKKAETIIAILDDREKLQQVREKAAATRDKYFGLSSTGITYKSSATSFSSNSYSSSDRYGSMSSSREADSFKDSYKDTERKTDYSSKSSQKTSHKSKKGGTHSRRNQDSSPSNPKPLTEASPAPVRKDNIEDDYDDFDPRGSSTSGTANVSSNQVDLFGPNLMDDLIDPSASTSTVPTTASTAAAPEIDLFADATFLSATAQVEATTGSQTPDNTDLFAGRPSFAASFTSDTEFSVQEGPSKSSEQKLSAPEQTSNTAFDPFQLSSAASFTSDTEFSVRESPSKSSEQKLSAPEQTSNTAFDPFQLSSAASLTSDTEFSVQDSPSKSSEEKVSTPGHTSSTTFDPFAAIPLNSFDGSDPFGAFSSSTVSATSEPSRSSIGGMKSSDHSPSGELNFGAFISHTESPTAATTESINKSPTKLEQASMSASKPAAKKETFQVKSGIWADSLSRGLIDLNITAPKKVNLSDIGIVGGLSDGSEEEKGPTAPWYMGTAMGMGSGLGRSGFPSSTGTSGSSDFSSLGQKQFGSYK